MANNFNVADTFPGYQFPTDWRVYGHSYVSTLSGAADQTGRPDSILMSALGVDPGNVRNHAVPGARITITGRSTGGWTRVMQERVPSLTRTAPYVNDGAASFFCYGVNDPGLLGNDDKMRTSYWNAHRAGISRARASVVWEDTNAVFAYGVGFTNLGFTENIGSGNSCRQCTVSGGTGTVTLTLPADYAGETVVLQFWGVASDTGHGGTVTFTGTALAGTPHTGSTLYTGAAMPAITFSQAPLVKRFTGLTSANAGQTIVATVTQIDASGTVYFDCGWLEAKAPPPVLVCNINRLTDSAYSFYGGWSGTAAQKDGHVLEWNVGLAAVVAEFDSMVKLVDLDALIGKSTTLTSDGIHPNELGGALIAGAAVEALKSMSPPVSETTGVLTSFNVLSRRRNGPAFRPRIVSEWYGPDSPFGTDYTAVAGDVFAIPFVVGGPREQYNRAALEATANVTGTTVRWGIYDDVAGEGYPQCLVVEFTADGAFTVTAGTGSKQNPAVGSTGSFTFVPNQEGLYWEVVKFVAVGTSHTFRTVAGPSTFLPNGVSGAGAVSPSGWKLSGQGTTALPTTFPTGATLVSNCPVVLLQCSKV